MDQRQKRKKLARKFQRISQTYTSMASLAEKQLRYKVKIFLRSLIGRRLFSIRAKAASLANLKGIR